VDKSELIDRFKVIFKESRFNASLKFFFEDDSSVLVDCRQDEPYISVDVSDRANAEFRAKYSDALLIFTGKLDPTRAILTRKLKVSGDVGLALKLARLINAIA
jgi:putative sterol carrier protein